jgi:methylmalonyl-CoA mutase cobalamin-binding domain/chain
MSEASLANKLKDALVSGVEKSSESDALQVAELCLKKKPPADVLVKSISEALNVIGGKFERGDYYLPELLFAGMMAEKVIKLLGPLLKSGESVKAGGKIVIGTVRGDLHDLGKNIVALMLRPAGVDVTDLGSDVPPEKFVEAIKRVNANVLGMSALLSTTREEMRTVINELKKQGIRNKVKVIVGGGAVNEDFAREIGADAYGKDAIEAVRLCKKFVGS